MALLRELTENDHSIYMVKSDFVRRFRDENHLTTEQTRLLYEQTKDGDLTITEIEELRRSTGEFSVAQIQAMYEWGNLEQMALYSSANMIVEAINGIDIKVTQITNKNYTYTQDSSYGEGTDSRGTYRVGTPQTVNREEATLSYWDKERKFTKYGLGGYTGDYPIDREVGVVHGQEYVIPARGVPVVRGDNGQKAILEKIYKKLEESEKHHKRTVEELEKVKAENERLRKIQNNLLKLEVEA
jgi:hypothetical protein